MGCSTKGSDSPLNVDGGQLNRLLRCLLVELGCFGGEPKLVALHLFISFGRADGFIVHDIGGGAFVLRFARSSIECC